MQWLSALNVTVLSIIRAHLRNRIMNEETFSLVQECTNKYFVENLNEEEVEIHIRAELPFQSGSNRRF